MAEVAQASPSRGSASRWVSLRRACEILGVDESTLRRWADGGRLRVYRTPGGHRRFSLNDLEGMVAGDNRHRGAEEVERLAVAKIRRQLRSARQQEHGWYASLSDNNRELLRDLGRRLIEMASEYLAKGSHHPGLLDEALEVGEQYGRVLIDAGLPLPSAVNAYIGFRKTMDETTRQTAIREALPLDDALVAYGQVHTLGDQVLLGLSSAYESTPSEAGRERD